MKDLHKLLNIEGNFLMAYLPQTDGQTERVNQILEQYLRCYVNYLQNDWAELLLLAEFTYNNTPQDSIGMTPFFANKGYHPLGAFSFKTGFAYLNKRELFIQISTSGGCLFHCLFQCHCLFRT